MGGKYQGVSDKKQHRTFEKHMDMHLSIFLYNLL